MKQFSIQILTFLVAITLLNSCKSGAVNLFKAATPHEQYQRKLTAAGLDKTAMGVSWVEAAKVSINKALSVQIPYRENGYFAAERIPATAYRFEVKRGQKINISLEKTSSKPMLVYLDVWEIEDSGDLKLIKSADTAGRPFDFDADDETKYILRLQPELLRSGSFTLQITSGPSLDFPIGQNNSPRVGSYFGDGRDANSRKHEGIDIFAKFHTPVVAIANGTVTRVNENNLGGKVVWLRPENKNYTLYYAHLDRQIATEGQIVKAGDTLGLVGNTGNARTTPPHLHFGLYTSRGAIDPLPFIRKTNSEIPTSTNAGLANINKMLRTSKKATLFRSTNESLDSAITLPSSTIVYATASFQNYLKVELPDGTVGYLRNNVIRNLSAALKKVTITATALPGYDQPSTLAAIKMNFTKGAKVDLLGIFSTYSLVTDASNETSWISNDSF